MNALKLIQKQGFTRYEFLLLEDTLSVRQATITENKEWVVKLDNIGYKTKIEKDTSYMKPGLFISMGLFAFLFVIGNAADHSSHLKAGWWITISIIYAWFAMTVFLSPLNNKLMLGNGSDDLIFLTDKPSEKEVREFVDEIILRSKKVLLRKYHTDPDLPEQLMISQLNWLLDMSVIDNEAFDVLKANYYSPKA